MITLTLCSLDPLPAMSPVLAYYYYSIDSLKAHFRSPASTTKPVYCAQSAFLSTVSLTMFQSHIVSVSTHINSLHHCSSYFFRFLPCPSYCYICTFFVFLLLTITFIFNGWKWKHLDCDPLASIVYLPDMLLYQVLGIFPKFASKTKYILAKRFSPTNPQNFF